MDATRGEVERELEDMERRLKGVQSKIVDCRDDIAKAVHAGVFSANNFAGRLHCLKLEEEEERQYLYTIKVLHRILDRTEEPAVEGGE